MKYILLIISASITFYLNPFLFAEETHPCKILEAACKTAGFYQGGINAGKGLYKDCIEPLANGKTIPGVKIEKTNALACKEKIDKRR